MKKRNPVLVCILSLITFNLYNVYWLYVTRKELHGTTGVPKRIPRVLWLCIPWIIFSIWALWLIVNGFNYEEEFSLDGLFLIAAATITYFVSLVIGCWWFYHFCRTAGEAGGALSWSSSYVVWVITAVLGYSFIWFAVAQNDLNQAIDSAAKPAHHA
ncbi:MAG TPA: hypothetical protein VD735_00130 [Candidatus Saccharimonadales bacterium]|nr:hypothetical protein [Candidatus Saccharimonadales bacterium]